MTKLRSGAIAMLAGALMLSGCASESNGTLPGGTGNETLVYGQTVVPNNLDPHKTAFTTDCLTLCPVYDRLIHLGPDGELVPGLAETWTFSDDGLELTLAIREGVTFHDATELDAESVKLSLDRARGMDDSAVKNELLTIEEVVVDDPRTVTLHLTRPDAALPGILSGLAGAVINPTALANNVNLSETMDGAGAFRFVSYVQGSELKHERNDDYWGEAPAIAGVTFKIIPDAAALTNAVQAGQVDVAMILPQNLTPFLDDDAFTVKTQTVLYQNTMITNFASAGLQDARLRQAIMHAIDRETICETIYSGYCEVTDQPFPEGYLAFDDSVKPILYPYDPDRARELLGQVGVDELHLKAVVPAAQFMALAQAIQSQLSEVGIQMDIQQVDSSAMVQQVFVDKTVDMVITGFAGRADPSQMFAVRFSEQGFYNPGAFTTERMQQLYVDSLKETDPDARLELLKAGSLEAGEAALAMMINFPSQAYVMKDGVDLDLYVSGLQEIRGVTKN